MTETGSTQGSKPPRTATKYVVLVEQNATVEGHETAVKVLLPIMAAPPNERPRVFEGFHKDDVLDEVLDGDYGVEVDEKTGKSGWLVILPESVYQRMRGTVEVKRSVKSERG